MKSIQQRIRARILETQDQESSILPPWLRALLRAFSGGADWTATFVRSLLWKYRWLIVTAVAANLGSAAAEAATLGVFTLALNQMTAFLTKTPATVSSTIDTYILQIAHFFGGQEPFVILIVLAVIFQLIRSGLDFAGQAATIYVRVWVEGELRRRIFSQLMKMRYQQIVDHRLGNLTSYNTQVNEIGSMVQMFNQAMNGFTIIVAYSAVLFWLSWQFTVVVLTALLVLSFSQRRLRTSIRSSAKGFLNLSIRLNERILEYLQGIRLVHIFVREEAVINEVNQLINRAIPPQRNALLRTAMIYPLFQSVATIGIAIFLLIGFWFVSQSNGIKVGELVTYAFVIYRIMPRLANLNMQIGTMSGQWPTLARVAQLLNPEGKEIEYLSGQPIEGIQEGIEFRGVSLQYPGGERDALRNLSFRIPAGNMVALVGASGSGKSSIVNLVLGLYRPIGGQILIDGVDLQQIDLASWRRLIGVVDQDTMIFSDTISENVRFGKSDASTEEVIAASKIAYADLFIKNLPQGYQTEVGDRGYRLSGGQRQRIAIARAVIDDPTLLLFDEATSALDSQSERLIQESLEELRKKRTVVAIAHRLSTIVKSDQIIVLDSGQIVEQGTHQELLLQGGRYAAMWRLQGDSA